jgi:hypothetical protein
MKGCVAQAHRRFEAVIPLAGYKVTIADYSPSVIVLARLTRYQDAPTSWKSPGPSISA